MKGKLLGDAIKKRRKVVGLTQDGLAEKVGGISRQGVQKWEAGAVPDSAKWNDIEAALQVGSGWLVSMMYEGSGGAIATGTDAIENPHSTPAHQSGSDPPQCPPPDQEEDDKLPTPSQAIEMTRSVLASRTIYRVALLQNIKAFYKAVEGEQEMGEMKNKVTNLENMIETLTREFREFRREQQFAGEETPAQKREVQGN